ncbi:MAG TPA: hypothetical protein VGE93_12800 [Bryobacteraceae bacterium]
MTKTYHKILFEVRLLHEFYLTQQDGTVIFSKAAAADRDSFLQQMFSIGRRSINRDIGYSIPDAGQSIFGDHRMHLVEAYSGFKIGIEVEPTTDGVLTAFSPKVPFPQDAAITVFIDRINENIDAYTSVRQKATIRGIGFLSNERNGPAKTAPFLTNPVPAFDGSYVYEQGELYDEAGKIKAFYTGITPADPGLPGTAFLNETDRLVVAPAFDYSFDAADNVKQAQFTITDPSAAQVYQNTFTSDTPLQKVTLNLDPTAIRKLPHGRGIDELLHQLTVTGDGGYNKTFPLIFLDAPIGELPWAAVNIAVRPADAAFQVIDDKGLLVMRLNADGSVTTPPPVFEVCIKSRLTFWQYANNLGIPIKNLYPAILTAAGNTLITQKPIFRTYLPVPVGTQRLPNPEHFSTPVLLGDRQCSVVIVPQTLADPFPKGP